MLIANVKGEGDEVWGMFIYNSFEIPRIYGINSHVSW